MKSFSYPDMFSTTYTNMVENTDATLSNLKLLLQSEKLSLFGDPYYGCSLKRFIYNQNNSVLRDLIIDEIYLAITTFMPQLSVVRKGIKVSTNPDQPYSLNITINCINKLNNESVTYEITMMV